MFCRIWHHGFTVHANRKCQLCLLGILFTPIGIYITVYLNWPVFHVFINQDIMSPCVLPHFDYYDKSIANFFWKPDPIKCEPWDALMFIDANGVLQYNDSAINTAGLTNLLCKYSKVVRVGDFNVTFGEETQFTKPVYIDHDIIYVKCMQNNKLVYDNLHFHIDYKSILETNQVKNETSDALSVYAFGFDSLSHLLAERVMPLTMSFLRDELGAYVLNGYTKVGDNSYPNLAALFTGTRGNAEIRGADVHTLPFIWRNFTSNGYVDLYSEDWPSIATFSGFSNDTTAHYFRPFFLAAEKIRTQSIRNIKRLLLFLEHHNFRLKDVSFLCFGNTPKHQLVIQYYKDFIEAYDKKRRIAFSFLNELGHDFLNFYDHADHDVANLFRWMKDTQKLENAVLVFYADHGPRYSEIQNTNIGRVTSMMPTLVIYIPKQIQERFPHLRHNLMKNSERLTTPFDIHATLMDVLNRKFELQKPLDIKQKLPRAISLFREVPEKRSCHEADVPEHYCPCYSSNSVSLDDPIVLVVSNFLIESINYLLHKDFHRCAKLTLKRTIRASIVKSNFVRDRKIEEWSLRTFVYTSGEDRRYLVAVEALPSNGWFESTIQYSGNSGMNILGNIDRINKYGNQSRCIANHRDTLTKYCYCT